MVYRSILRKIAAIVIVWTGSTVAVGAEPPKTTTEQDIVYKKAGSTELKLDLVRPADGDGPFPAVVVIHGGAWRQGNKAGRRK
jgi:acetyl esterase/lipase